MAAIISAAISLSGCSQVFRTESEQTQIKPEKSETTAEDSVKTDNKSTGTDSQISKESESGKEGEYQDFSKSAYYYYVKSERHKQKGEMGLAIDALKQAIASDPESIYLKKSMIFLHLLNKDSASAMAVAREVNQQHPDDEDILLILAKLKLQSNQLDEAKALYQRIIQINPENHDAYIVLGNIYMESRETEESFRLFSTMVSHFPESYAAHFFLGKINAEKRNFTQAEKEFLKSIQLEKDLVEPRLELITIYKSRQAKQKNLSKKIVALYEEILEIDKENVKAAIELALYLYKKGEKSRASEMLVNFGKRYQNNETILTAMAKELINGDNKNDAMVVFNEILKADPQNSTVHYIAGLTFDALKESMEAISHFLKVASGSQQYQKSVFHIAYLYSQMKQPDKSIEFLETKLKEFEKDTDFISYLAAFYEEANQLDKAVALLQKGLEFAPDDTELLFRSGTVSDKAGDKEGCIKAMKRIIEIDPLHASALNYLGYTYAELGTNLDEAEQLVIRSLEIKPEDGYVTDSLGWVYYKKGQYDKAIEILEKAVNLSSEDPTILDHLGDAYRANRIYQKAIDAYRRALSKNQNHENRPVLEKKIHETEYMLRIKK